MRRLSLGLLAAALLSACGGLPTHLADLSAPGCQGPIDAEQALAITEGATDWTLKCDVLRARRQLPETVARAHLAAMLADRFDPDDAERAQLGTEALRTAEALLEDTPDDGPAHYYAGLGLGIAVEHDPVLALKYLKPLEYHLRRAVDLAPLTHQGGPLRVLGLLYLRAPAWPEGPGDLDAALELLQRAATEAPAHPLNPLSLAEALAADDRADEAAQALDAAEAALAAWPPGVMWQRWAAQIAAGRAGAW